MKVTEYYHVGNYVGGKTACGFDTFGYGLCWDEPCVWQKKETSSFVSGSLPKCPECLASEDLPLFMLGDMP